MLWEIKLFLKPMGKKNDKISHPNKQNVSTFTGLMLNYVNETCKLQILTKYGWASIQTEPLHVGEH